MAAAYAWHHGFSDGNKRTAWVVAKVFLADNDAHLQFSEIDAIRAMGAVAIGALDEQ